MDIYLVGGAVRDGLLGLPIKDRDWLVVGSSAEEMLAQGYQAVGSDFPVFLHPDTNEEYALARTERKSAKGHTGFVCDASASVSLEDDLQRRDLTINAIAKGDDGQLHDPYGGVDDLNARVLRHVSDAFVEDPLRVLRVARFAARYRSLGFTVATETLELMRHIADSGELASLTAERVWQELSRALMEPRPDEFIRVLQQSGALAHVFPELDALFGVPQPAEHHPEIDTGVHLLLALEQAATLSLSLAGRFSVLCHDLGKGTTPAEEWPKHTAHEMRSKNLTLALCKKFKVPSYCRDIAALVAEYHTHVHRAHELNPKTLLKLFERWDLLRREERLPDILGACEADARGRTGFEKRDYPQVEFLNAAFTACRQINMTELQAQGLQGLAMGEAIRRERLNLLKRWRSNVG